MTYFTKRELIRAAELLQQTDPRSSEYHVLLRSIEFLDSMGQTLDAIAELDPNEAPKAADTGEDTGAIKVREQKADGKVVPFTAPEYPEAAEDEPPEDPPQTVEVKSYSPADVRRALVAARSKGVDIKAVLAKVGADNFQGVPAAKYGEIMKELGVV